MKRRVSPIRLAVLRRVVLWLLVAAVPWQVAVASSMTVAMAMPAAQAASSTDGSAAPCHEMQGEHAGASADAGATTHTGAGCTVCAACCVLAAPPVPTPTFEPASAPRDRATTVVQPAAAFLTDGPLRPPRSPHV